MNDELKEGDNKNEITLQESLLGQDNLLEIVEIDCSKD